jgi:hypothetical protein
MGPVLSLRPEPVGEESTHAAFQTIPLPVQKFDLDRRKAVGIFVARTTETACSATQFMHSLILSRHIVNHYTHLRGEVPLIDAWRA